VWRILAKREAPIRRTTTGKGALAKKIAQADEMCRAAYLREAADKSNTLKYNASLARAKKGSVALLLHNRARGMSEAGLIRVWGRDLVSATSYLL
tara:strand:+ start:418 stop:702 length:285 start_codon:yes stop_codon:yes gene_type:complete